MQVIVKVDAQGVTAKVQAFRLALADRRDLLKVIGAGQLLSVYKTFDEEGPGWPPLAPSTVRRYGARAAGHKLLVLRGILRNSIRPEVISDDAVQLGTNVPYAAVQNFGSADFGADIEAAESPLQFLAGVRAHVYGRRLGKGRLRITNAAGRGQTVTRNLEGPRKGVHVGAHSRRQNIPPRPYMVFRSEDPARIAEEVRLFVEQKKAEVGLV